MSKLGRDGTAGSSTGGSRAFISSSAKRVRKNTNAVAGVVKADSPTAWRTGPIQRNSVKKVVITTDSEQLFKVYTDLFKSYIQVEVVIRSREFASLKTSINKTIKMIVDLQEAKFDAVGIVSLEYPLIDVSVVDEAIDTLNIFKSDSVITVIAGQGPYYRHTGQTLKAILNQDKYTVLEREYLFSGSGGVAISSYDSFCTNGVLIADRVAHILLDHKHSFGVFSDFDFELFNKYISNES
jgi:CMP-N-acetylneuraminic acid synthetase